MKLKKTKLSDFLTQIKDSFEVQDNIVYKQVTVSNKWIVKLRETKEWSKIGTKKQFYIKKWNFIYSRLWLHTWAFWIAPYSLDWAIVTWDMPVFEINNSKILTDFLTLSLNTDFFRNQLNWLNKWVAQSRIREKIFLDLEILVPESISEQEEILHNYSKFKVNFDILSNITNKNLNYIKQLKQAILQEAIEWKLTKSWREKNPNTEPASVLLEKIKAEKEELIQQKKLKKQKPLKEISQDEIPFEIPENWSWCRLGEVVQFNPRNNLDNNMEVSFIPMKLIEDWFSNKHTSEIKKWENIKSWFTHFAERDVVFAKITPCFENKKSAIMTNLTNWFWAWTTELIVIRTFKELILPEFILFFVKNDNFINFWVSTFTWTAWQQRVDRSKIEDIFFPLPPLEEQKEIVKKVDELMKYCNELEKQTLDTKENSENLMKAVLSEVFSR